MRKIIILIALILVIQTGFSQQLHFTSQYLQHNSMYNPAAAGFNDGMVGVSYRSQWASFPGNPRTFMLYGDFALRKLNAGIGAYIYRDETGPTSRTGIQLAYSYHVRTGENSHLGLGLELRVLQFAIDKNKLMDALGGNNDPILGGSDKKIGIDAGAGVYWTNNKFSIGAAVSQLIQSKLELANVPNSKEGGKLYRHYNFTANYRIQTGDDIYIIPNAMVRVIEHSPSEYDFGAKLDYQDKLWWALNWRVKQFWSIQAGFKLLQRIRLTYSYDYYETPISVFSGGSGAHEIGLQFGFKKK